MKRCLSFVSVVMLLASGMGMAADEEVLALVKQTASEVLSVVSARKTELKAHPERMRDALIGIAGQHFDFKSMTRSAVGKYWRRTNAGEQRQLTDEFTSLLIRTYGSALLNYSGEPIDYGGTRRSKDGERVMVNSIVNMSSGSKVPINYQLHQVGGNWKVYDVVIDGVSLVSNYRTSFATEIRNGGISGLIAKLKERNAASK